ncbi:MAG: hypothetical protein JNL74_17965 [Fibrobacteres bacterium]|nr:hypothetical protein [Fibrobacterota bacterium]
MVYICEIKKVLISLPFVIILLFCNSLTFSSQQTPSLNQTAKLLSDALISSFPTGSGTLPKIGVMPFLGAEASVTNEGTAMAEALVFAINKTGRFTLVDRLQYQQAIREIALSQSGADASAKELDAGKFMVAEYLITGTVASVFGQSSVRARLVRVETGEVLATAQAVLESTTLSREASTLLGEQQSVLSHLFRSALVPGWGQFYAEKKIRGSLALSICAAALGTTVYSWVSSGNAETDRDNFAAKANTQSGRASLEAESGASVGTEAFNTWVASQLKELDNDYNNAHSFAVTATAITTGLWLINMVDATIAGRQHRESVRLYFSINQGQPVVQISLKF